MEPKDLDALLKSCREHGVVKLEAFGVSVIFGPAAPKRPEVAAEAPKGPPAPALPERPTVADVEKLEAELFAGMS